MELYFRKFKDGTWGVGFHTDQAEMPAILEQAVIKAVKDAVGKFNEKYGPGV